MSSAETRAIANKLMQAARKRNLQDDPVSHRSNIISARTH